MKTLFLILVSQLIILQINAQVTVQTNMPVINEAVNSIVRYKDTLYIGGKFTMVGGQPRSYLVAIDAKSGAVLPWNPQPDGFVNQIIIVGNELIVGGSFDSINGVAKSNIAIFNLDSGTMKNDFIQSTTSVEAMVYHDGYVYYNNGQFWPDITRFDINTDTTDFVWGSYLGFYVSLNSMTILGNYLYLGGYDFSAFSKDVVRIELATGLLDTTYGIATGGWVEQVLGYNNHLYVTGSFTSIKGVPRKGFVELDSSGNVTSLDIGCSNSQNYALFPQSNTLWVGGNSAWIGGTYNYRIAQIDINTGLATCWNTYDCSGYGYINRILVSNDTVYAGAGYPYVGGTFTVLNGNPSFTSLGADTTICTPFSYTINADPGFQSYLWGNGATTSSITVNAVGNYWVTGTRANGCKATDSLRINACVFPSVSDYQHAMNLQLYPNPVNDFLTITGYGYNDDYVISIENVYGQLMKSMQIKVSVNSINQQIDLSELSSGIYFITIKGDQTLFFSRIVKQ